MIYAYYFNFAHLLELTIKLLYKYNLVTVEIPANHEFGSMYSNAKNDILELGLNNNEFNKIANAINQIKTFTIYQNDLPVAFKYPVGKDFNTIIIKDKFLKMKTSEKRKIIEGNKETIWVIKLLIVLCYLKNSEEKLIAKINTLNDIQEQIEYISQKYNI